MQYGRESMETIKLTQDQREKLIEELSKNIVENMDHWELVYWIETEMHLQMRTWPTEELLHEWEQHHGDDVPFPYANEWPSWPRSLFEEYGPGV